MFIIKICLTCKKEFKAKEWFVKKGFRKYCSRKCRDISRTTSITNNCLTCGKEFKVSPSRIKAGTGKYCSYKCRSFPLKGKKLSEDRMKKLNPQKGENNGSWKGGKRLRGGYIFIYNTEHPSFPNARYVMRSRLVVESQIGRYLTLKEVVHHRGKKDDDRPKMLIAFSSRSAHQRFHGNPQNVKPSEIIFDGRSLLTHHL